MLCETGPWLKQKNRLDTGVPAFTKIELDRRDAPPPYRLFPKWRGFDRGIGDTAPLHCLNQFRQKRRPPRQF